MSILPILQYPHPDLYRVCLPVEDIDDGVRTLTQDLVDTMRAAPGIGITGAHVGIFLRVFALELPDWPGPRFYINPQILDYRGEPMHHTEGSVSMPGALEDVLRPSVITLQYQDIDGVQHHEEVAGFHATCIQHEIDQLDGIFWLKRLSRLKRDRLLKKWKRQKSG